MIPGARLDELLKDAVFSQRRMEEIEQNIDEISVTQAQQTLARVFMTSLATRHIDYTGILRETLEAEENRLVPEYVEDYFLRAYRRLGGRIEERKLPAGALYHIANVPYELRRWSENYDFKSSYGALFRTYRQVTFDKQQARQDNNFEFVAPGHPLLEAINEEILSRYSGRDSLFAAFADPEGQREGALWFVEGEITDGRGQTAGKRVFCLYQPVNGPIKKINPAVLWDYRPLTNPDVPADLLNLLYRQEVIEDHIVTELLFPFQAEIAERRAHETHVKEKYGLRSLDYLIQESNQKILDYQMRQLAGDQIELPLLNEQRNLEQLQQRRRDLEQEIELERNLTVNEPRILGAAVLLSGVVDSDTQDGQIEEGDTKAMHDDRTDYVLDQGVDAARRREIELAGMAVAMAYERAQGRQPEDVSAENHGFDVRSLRYEEDGTLAEIRYIEVKARAQSGAIRLSANEWKKARRHGEQYWLYIITQAATNEPQLQQIQNPADQFSLDEDIFATGFIIPEDRWQSRRVVQSDAVNRHE
jgi:hypothetical protein